MKPAQCNAGSLLGCLPGGDTSSLGSTVNKPLQSRAEHAERSVDTTWSALTVKPSHALPCSCSRQQQPPAAAAPRPSYSSSASQEVNPCMCPPPGQCPARARAAPCHGIASPVHAALHTHARYSGRIHGPPVSSPVLNSRTSCVVADPVHCPAVPASRYTCMHAYARRMLRSRLPRCTPHPFSSPFLFMTSPH